MENIPFRWVAGGLTVLQRTNSTHSKGEGIGGKCLERENIWPTEKIFGEGKYLVRGRAHIT